jgi:hypothetical protein
MAELIYRIHRADDIGNGERDTCPAHAAKTYGFNSSRHPSPYTEGHRMNRREVCGFRYPRQFYEWFPTFEQRAAVARTPNFILSLFEVEHAIHLPRQSVFDLKTIISHHPLLWRTLL